MRASVWTLRAGRELGLSWCVPPQSLFPFISPASGVGWYDGWRLQKTPFRRTQLSLIYDYLDAAFMKGKQTWGRPGWGETVLTCKRRYRRERGHARDLVGSRRSGGCRFGRFKRAQIVFLREEMAGGEYIPVRRSSIWLCRERRCGRISWRRMRVYGRKGMSMAR